jgi:hypothetical protein
MRGGGEEFKNLGPPNISCKFTPVHGPIYLLHVGRVKTQSYASSDFFYFICIKKVHNVVFNRTQRKSRDCG